MLRIPTQKARAWPPFGKGERMYAGGRSSRLTSGWSVSNTSADAELSSSLTELRSRSRALVRDSSYAKRAKTVIVNNVIGCGIGMQAEVKTARDELNERVNEDIEDAFEEWSYSDSCHTGGRLCFADLERALIGQVVEAGEVFVRRHFRAFGASKVPYALELIEAERLADTMDQASLAVVSGNQMRMGIEMDSFYRPVAYHIRKKHPSEVRWTGDAIDLVERVPAREILHLARVDRWPQTRGEPWFHAVTILLNDMDGYSEAEIVRARSQAAIAGAIETPEDASAFGEVQSDGSTEMTVEPGTYKRLNPGEKLTVGPANSPNPTYSDFMRAELRQVAAGTGVSYESISRDYSQSNYSSSRMGLLEDRDLWRDVQQWFIRTFREPVHKEWLEQAVLAGALSTVPVEAFYADRAKYEEVRFRPRGWSWVDPTSEVTAYKEAVRCGFMSLQDVITATSDRDVEEVFEDRKEEMAEAAAIGLTLDTDPAEINGQGSVQALSLIHI